MMPDKILSCVSFFLRAKLGIVDQLVINSANVAWNRHVLALRLDFVVIYIRYDSSV